MNPSKALRDLRAFNRFYTNIIGVVDRHILNSPYSLTEVRIMFEVYHRLNSTVREIKNFLRVDEGYLSRTIDRLAKRRLIRKQRSPNDGRSFLLSLTSKGAKEFLALDRKSDERTASLLQSLSGDEIAELVRITRRIQELLRKSDGRTN